MGTFDARCALTGVVIRTEQVVLLPLICSSATLGRIIGLPRRGRYDGAGGLAGAKKCPLFTAFAQSLAQRGSFGSERPEPRRLLRRLIDLDDQPAKLGMRQLGFTYALESVYDALVSMGLRDEAVAAKLQGKKRDASLLFELAMFEGKTSRILYERVAEDAQKKLRIHLLGLVRSGLGHRDLQRVAGPVEHTPAEMREALDRARSDWSTVPEVGAALEAYAAA